MGPVDGSWKRHASVLTCAVTDPDARFTPTSTGGGTGSADLVDAWWTDCSEPFEADWNGAREPSPEERMRINTTEAERYLGPDRSNAYSLLHSRGIWEGQRATGARSGCST
ncbi:hypothetical protein [Streptomyces sp. ME18-1-4]|uniref:hypothetical protein n=1 Tax=Streptomyces sp. ME18-1-4 TaxID=3028685 RepID=UPI0029AB5A1E|nr:hypothetical protein [Streptomyces sp. ME18-1-4]MDX3240270.1 hypothetical protein [Streptomyces sp. ME18-1-4]